MSKLGKKDFEILDFIKEQQLLKGFPPSVREICEAVGLSSTASIHAHLKKLEEHGKIMRDSSKNRSIKVVGLDSDAEFLPKLTYADVKYVDIPVYGNVAAGIPITAVESNEQTFPLPIDYVGNKEMFMLKVCGESMINAAILDGDYVIVQKQQTAENGEIVVALVDNRENATVKTFYKENGYIRLQPENDTMEPIIVNDADILGKVVGVFRKM